jgi:hypothetical protein
MERLCGYGRHCFVTLKMLSPMPDPIENDGRSSAYWRKRARDARARSAEMTDAAAEAKLQTNARMYDQMADHAAKREARLKRV